MMGARALDARLARFSAPREPAARRNIGRALLDPYVRAVAEACRSRDTDLDWDSARRLDIRFERNAHIRRMPC